MADDPLITFLAARLAEAWSAARDRELAADLNESAETRMIDALRAILAEIKAVRNLTERTGGKADPYRGWILRHLAAVWSGHPDYRPEWAL